MFFAEAQIRVHLYGKPADMRKSYDGLQDGQGMPVRRISTRACARITSNRRVLPVEMCLEFERRIFNNEQLRDRVA